MRLDYLRQEADAFAAAHLAQIQALAVRRFGLTSGFQIAATWDWSTRRTRSRGGYRRGPVISIAMRTATLSRPFDEYASIAADPVIGSVPCRTWQSRLLTVLAHEVAHAVQYAMLFGTQPTVALRGVVVERGHGPGWQAIYRVLRAEYVNPRIPAFEGEARPKPAPAVAPARPKRVAWTLGLPLFDAIRAA